DGRGARRSIVLLDPAGEFVAAGDQAGAALVGEIRPGPLDHHDQAIAESDEEKNVDEEPCQPGEISGQVKLAGLSELGDGGGAADGGQAAFVVVPKFAARLIFKVAGDGVRHPFSLLDGDRCDSGGHLAVFVCECGEVADNQYLGMSGNAEVGLDEHATGAINRNSQLS